MLRQIFAAAYPTGNEFVDVGINFLSADTKIYAIDSGRLSFAFIAKHHQHKVFLKIVKPGFVRSNIPFSVHCTEACRQYSNIPTFQTYQGGNGAFYQTVPDQIENIPDAVMRLFAGQMITLTAAARPGIDFIPELLSEIPGGTQGQIALMETLGEYIVRVSSALQYGIADLPKNIITEDPAGFTIGRQVAIDVFQLDAELTCLRSDQSRLILQKNINNLLPNLGRSQEAQAFKRGLQKGDLEKILDRFNLLEQAIQESLKQQLADNVIINNEIKPANIGAKYNLQENHWQITQSFDFDNCAWGNARNGDQTPMEKDLGRTISFFAFDNQSGEFFPAYAQATIKGYCQRLLNKITSAEIYRLKHYIQLGLITSYLWRASYFAEELAGNDIGIQLSRLDPSIHMLQLQSFDVWLENNSLEAMVAELEKAPVINQYRAITHRVMQFRHSPAYIVASVNGELKKYDDRVEAEYKSISVTNSIQ